MGYQVHQASTHLTDAPGPDQRPGVGVASAPDHHVVPGLDLGDQGGCLGRPVGQVGVGEDHRPTGGHGHPRPDRRALARVALQAHHPVGACGLGTRRRVVRRAVVDHDDLHRLHDARPAQGPT